MVPTDIIRVPVTISDKTLYVTGSGYIDEFEPMGNGIFFDRNSWSRLLEDVDSDGEFILIDWPDFGVVPLDQFQTILTQVARQMQSDVPLEIGCIGAKGRTGTVLAGMLIACEGFDYINAVEEIRLRYHLHAVETKGQHDLLCELEDSGFHLTLTAPRLGFWRRVARFFHLG